MPSTLIDNQGNVWTIADGDPNVAAITGTDGTGTQLGDVSALTAQLSTAQATLTAAQAQDASDEAALATAQAAIAQAITDLGGTPPASATAGN